MFRIIELTSAELVNIRAPNVPDFVQIETNEDISLGLDEFGIILGKRSHMLSGSFCQVGIVHPGFKGRLSPFFIVYGRWTVPPGTKIAHLVIFSDKAQRAE